MNRLFKRKKNKDKNLKATLGQEEEGGSASNPDRPDGTANIDLPNTSKTGIDVYLWLAQGFGFIRDVSESTPVLAPLKSACSLAITALEVAQQVRDNDTAWADMISDIRPHIEHMQRDVEKIEKKTKSSRPDALKDALEQYLNSLKMILMEAETALQQAGMDPRSTSQRKVATRIDKERIAYLRDAEARAFQRYQIVISDVLLAKISETAELVEEIRGDVRASLIQNRQLDNYATPESVMRASYGNDLELCEEGTRIEILATIRQWGDAKNNSQQIFWLNDAAGTGKSTIAASMAKAWKDGGQLGGRFFFSPNIALNQDLRYFCRTVACDIVANHAQLAVIVDSTLSTSPEASMDFPSQFSRLIREPLRRLRKGEDADRYIPWELRAAEAARVYDPVFLVIDALDNCEYGSRQRLLNTIIKELPKEPYIKVLLTSRPLPDIADALQDPELVRAEHLLDINNPSSKDIAHYVHARLDQRLSIEDRERIIHYSAGLFIWAATFCRAFERNKLAQRLLDDLSHSKIANPLDRLYLAVLEQALVDKKARGDFKKILEVVISVFQPISINTISALFPNIDAVNEFVQDLGAILKDGHPDRPIKVLHSTFREFAVSDEDRANGFHVQMDPSHSMLASACLDVLEKSLKYDILDVKSTQSTLSLKNQVTDPDTLLTRTSPALRYASSYWAHHIAASEEAWTHWQRVTLFLQKHYLHWVELVGWQGTVGYGLHGLRQVRSRILNAGRSSTPHDSLTIEHAFQFLLRFQDIIKASALHTYTMPICLTPPDSPLLASWNTKNTIKALITSESSWTSEVVITGMNSGIAETTFSPDGRRIVTLGGTGGIRLWDVETGEALGPGLPDGREGGTEVQALEFSPDSRSLAIVDSEGFLHLWDTLNGQTLWKAEVYKDFTYMAARLHPFIASIFFPDDTYIALAGRNLRDGDREYKLGFVVFYTRATGKRSPERLGLYNKVDEFHLTPDKKRAVYTARTNTDLFPGRDKVSFVSLIDMDTSKELMNMEIPKSQNRHIEMSPDGARIALYAPFYSGTTLMILLDGNNGSIIEPVTLEGMDAHLVRFSPNSRLMATCPRDISGIHVRDIRDGRILRWIPGFGQPFDAIWISPDSTRVAGYSRNAIMKVWDISNGDELQSLVKGYIGGQRVILSPDWTRLVLNHLSAAVIYSTESQIPGSVTPLGGGRYAIGEYLAATSTLIERSYSNDVGRVSIWKVQNGSRRLVVYLGEYSGTVFTRVTPDQQRLLCCSSTGDLSYYSLSDYNILPMSLQGLKGAPTRAPVFSPDGRLVAFQNKQQEEEFVQVWNCQSGSLVFEYIGETTIPVVLAADGILIALADSADTWICNMQTGVKAKLNIGSKLSRISDQIDAVSIAFSPDSRAMVTVHQARGGRPRALCLWSVWPSCAVSHKDKAEFQHEIASAHHLGFSTDGNWVVYGSIIWKIQTNWLIKYLGSMPPVLRDHPFSFLTYDDGWIYSAFPTRRIAPIPTYLRISFSIGMYQGPRWSANGNTITVYTHEGPFILDFSALMSN